MTDSEENKELIEKNNLDIIKEIQAVEDAKALTFCEAIAEDRKHPRIHPSYTPWPTKHCSNCMHKVLVVEHYIDNLYCGRTPPPDPSNEELIKDWKTGRMVGAYGKCDLWDGVVL